MNRNIPLPYNYMLLIQLNRKHKEQMAKRKLILKQRKQIDQLQNIQRYHYYMRNNYNTNVSNQIKNNRQKSNTPHKKFPSYIYDKGQNNVNIIRKKWK